jgi:hypothetical protein
MKNENSEPCPSTDDINIFSKGPNRPTVFYEVYRPMPVPKLFILWLLKVAYGLPI